MSINIGLDEYVACLFDSKWPDEAHNEGQYSRGLVYRSGCMRSEVGQFDTFTHTCQHINVIYVESSALDT